MRTRVTVTGLNVYPVKSMRGTARERVRVAATGLEWDRQWMLIDARGMFLSQRTHPQLARIVPEITTEALVLTAPGLPPLTVPLAIGGKRLPVCVWDDTCNGVDEGGAAHEWVSEAAGQRVRLVRVAPEMERNADPDFAGTTPAPLNFVDAYPFLICNQASLDDLNARMPESVPMERFRPNIVIEGPDPWAEDRIDSITLGNVTLRLVKPCIRCTIPSIDQRTGERSTDPVRVLKTFRNDRALRGVKFGENAVIAAGAGAELTVGAEGEVTFDPS